jgi:adenylosuccinate lyase
MRFMPVHPIEFRYRYPEMYSVFTEETKLQKWLDVEAALAWAHAQLGIIPLKTAEEIGKKAKIDIVKLERVKEIESEIHHDLMAMVRALTEVCEGSSGNYVHLGATSYDIVDSALGLIFHDAIEILELDLKNLLKTLLFQAEQNKKTICIGRTHGQHALPTTYGMKFGVWASEVARHIDRIRAVRSRIEVGKMSGAVGTMAGFGEKGFQVQKLTMKKLGLKPVTIANQIIQRDRHAELLCTLALIAGTLDKIATEIRNLQRTEIAEVFEPFREDQVGSSTMPQKRNPHKSERICGLSRIIRSSVVPALETINLEHERDLSNSSLERVIFPEAFILTDYIIRQTINILEGLVFKHDNIIKNLESTLGLCLTERVMLELVEKGVGRQEAHEMLRRIAMKCWNEKLSLKQVIMQDLEAKELITEEELNKWLEPENYLGTAYQQVEIAIKKLSPYLEN